VLAVLGLLTLGLSACTSAGAKPKTGKPNIVFVLTDDLSWNLVSHMPHVQALQKSGLTMSRYYVVDSLCCPSRSAIFTGEYPHDDGVFTNSGRDGGYRAYNANGNQTKSFAVALQHARYRTGFMGKYLNGYQPKNPVPPGWNEWDVTGNGYPEYNYTLNENGSPHRYGHAPSDYLTDVLSNKAGSFVDNAAKSDKPFMLQVATFAPHGPYTPAPRYVGAANDVAYPKTTAYDSLSANPPSWLAGRAPLTATEQQALSADYRKRIEADLAVDDMIGHLEARLQASGQAKNTYFVFSSDNGYHMGEYRLLAGKQTAFDTDIHVPLVVAGPGVPAGRTDSRLTSNIDLAPTFESLGGAQIGTDVDGVSLAGVWHGHPPTTWQRGVLVEHHGPDNAKGDPDRQNARRANPPSYEAVRTATGLYVRYASGQQEFYDTAKDPNELRNLAPSGIPPSLPRMLDALQHCHHVAACQSAAGA
jgi:N-acetylglucosamine-6-sulfatase